MGLYAMQWAFHAPIHSAGAKFLLVALAEHARDEGEGRWTCFPSIKRLSKWTAQGERTVERHLAWLAAEGWISGRPAIADGKAIAPTSTRCTGKRPSWGLRRSLRRASE